MKKVLSITLLVEVNTELEGVDNIVNNIEISAVSISENVDVEKYEVKDFFEVSSDSDEVSDDSNMHIDCLCPECGHEFAQGEYNYNYDTGMLDFECPDCGWEGNETETFEIK